MHAILLIAHNCVDMLSVSMVVSVIPAKGDVCMPVCLQVCSVLAEVLCMHFVLSFWSVSSWESVCADCGRENGSHSCSCRHATVSRLTPAMA